MDAAILKGTRSKDMRNKNYNVKTKIKKGFTGEQRNTCTLSEIFSERCPIQWKSFHIRDFLDKDMLYPRMKNNWFRHVTNHAAISYQRHLCRGKQLVHNILGKIFSFIFLRERSSISMSTLKIFQKLNHSDQINGNAFTLGIF